MKKALLVALICVVLSFLFASTAMAAPTLGITLYGSLQSGFGAQVSVPIGAQNELIGRVSCRGRDATDLDALRWGYEAGYRLYFPDDGREAFFVGLYCGSTYNYELADSEIIVSGTFGIGGKLFHYPPHYVCSCELGLCYRWETGFHFCAVIATGYAF